LHNAKGEAVNLCISRSGCSHDMSTSLLFWWHTIPISNCQVVPGGRRHNHSVILEQPCMFLSSRASWSELFLRIRFTTTLDPLVIGAFISLKHRLTEIHRNGRCWTLHTFCLSHVSSLPHVICRAAHSKSNLLSTCNGEDLQLFSWMSVLTPEKSSGWVSGGKRTLEPNKGWGVRFWGHPAGRELGVNCWTYLLAHGLCGRLVWECMVQFLRSRSCQFRM